MRQLERAKTHLRPAKHPGNGTKTLCTRVQSMPLPYLQNDTNHNAWAHAFDTHAPMLKVAVRAAGREPMLRLPISVTIVESRKYVANLGLSYTSARYALKDVSERKSIVARNESE